MLRLYEAIRSTVLDRLRYTIVHWINQPIICVIRAHTWIITSNCRSPKFHSYRTYLALKQWMLKDDITALMQHNSY